MSVRVMGYVMARDEWPLLGLAVTHALSTAVDHVVVVNHASEDGTSTGLRHLQQAWPGRLTVIHLREGVYLQEATTAVIMAAVGADDYDWVYAFDADEFLLTGSDHALADLLQHVSDTVDAVRYEVNQWIAPSDMDEFDPAHYARLNDKAIPCLFTNPPSETLAHDIEHGIINFFDVPFNSKVIVRARHAHVLAAGAHLLRSNQPVKEETLNPAKLRAGHLPLLSRKRLALKSRQGKALIEAKFPSWHGWQNQMLRRIDLAGNLDRFWLTHSTPRDGRAQSSSTPVSVVDLGLTHALKDAIQLFDDYLWMNAGTVVSDPQPSHIDVDRLIALTHALKSERDQAVAEREQVEIERALLQTRLEAIEASRTWRAAGIYRRMRARMRLHAQ